MTDLLTPATTRRASEDTSPKRPPRPLALGAALAGVLSAGFVLAGCMAWALAGWFASDAGGHGDTRDALRVGADGWLLAHGSHLKFDVATISVAPLGLSLLCVYVAFRLGRRTARTCVVQDVKGALLATTVLAGGYGVVAVLTAVLASLEQARPQAGLAFAGAFLIAFLGGGTGIVAGSGLWPQWRRRLPETPLAVVTGAVTGVLLLAATASLLLAVALIVDLGAAANVLSRLHADVPGGLLYTLVVAAVAPNAVLLTGSYLVGPGFAVGAGTVVSPSAVVLGPLPAFPLLAALPDGGATPWWTAWLIGVPVLVGGGAAVLMLRRFPVTGYEVGSLRGLLSGAVAGILVSVLVAFAGGSVGPGRMADVGAPFVDTLLAAVVAMSIGGLVGGVATTWWQRRRATGSD